MADGTFIEQALAALGGAATSGVASVVGMARKFGKRFKKLEERVEELEGLREKILREVGAQFDQREASLDDRIQRSVHSTMARTSSVDIQSGRLAGREAGLEVARATLSEVRRDIARIEAELKEVRTTAEAATPDDSFTEHVAAEAGRWQDVHRSLGQIEGMIGAVNDRLRLRGGPR